MFFRGRGDSFTNEAVVDFGVTGSGCPVLWGPWCGATAIANFVVDNEKALRCLRRHRSLSPFAYLRCRAPQVDVQSIRAAAGAPVRARRSGCWQRVVWREQRDADADGAAGDRHEEHGADALAFHHVANP